MATAIFLNGPLEGTKRTLEKLPQVIVVPYVTGRLVWHDLFGWTFACGRAEYTRVSIDETGKWGEYQTDGFVLEPLRVVPQE